MSMYYVEALTIYGKWESVHMTPDIQSARNKAREYVGITGSKDRVRIAVVH